MSKNKTQKSQYIKEQEKPEPTPVRNKYIGGVCKECGNDYTDIESHYKRYPEHRKKEIKS